MTSYNFLPVHKYPDFYLSILACINIVYFGSDAAAELVFKVRFAAVQYKSSRRGGDLVMIVVLLQFRVSNTNEI